MGDPQNKNTNQFKLIAEVEQNAQFLISLCMVCFKKAIILLLFNWVGLKFLFRDEI